MFTQKSKLPRYRRGLMLVIFGGSGFIGTSLRVLLDNKGIDYIASSIDLTSPVAPSRIKDQVKNGDTIIMISAYTGEHGPDYHLTDLNVRMGATLMAGIKDKNVKCVYVSSDSVYGDVNGIISESTPVIPTSLYGHMHALREQMFKIPELTILRPCAVYGREDTHNAYGINQFIKTAKETGEITLFGDGEECRSNIHVDDLAAIIAKAALFNVIGTFNVNCGRTYSFKKLAEIIQSHTGAKILSKPRTAPITHRYVNNANLVKHFFTPRLPEEGIAQLMED